jgi:hypothetical protein
MDVEAAIERFRVRMEEAERLEWRDRESLSEAFEAAIAAIEALKEIIEHQQEMIERLTGPTLLQ